MSSNATTQHHRSLDGLRGLAVLLVMLSHFITAGNHIDDSNSFFRILRGGFIGVDLFFVLSGFLITGILLDAPKSSSRYFSTFYLRRAVRIFPLYYAILLGTFLFLPSPQDSPLWYWLFSSNLGATFYGRWLDSPPGVNLSHLWSLAVEEQFYLLWPLIVYFLARRWLARLCIALLILSPLIHFALYFSGNPIGAYLFTGARLHPLAAGALLALLYREPSRWQRLLPIARKVSIAAAILTIVGLIFPRELSLVPFAPFLWGPVLMLALQPGSFFQRHLSHSFWVHFGKYSYALYLFHYLLDPWLKETVYAQWVAPIVGRPFVSVLLFIPIATLISLIAAWISWLLLERPFLSLKRHFQYRQETIAKTP